MVSRAPTPPAALPVCGQLLRLPAVDDVVLRHRQAHLIPVPPPPQVPVPAASPLGLALLAMLLALGGAVAARRRDSRAFNG